MEDHRETVNSGETKPTSMEDHRQTLNSDDTKLDSTVSDFEFGSLTPTSPSQDPFIENSPADHLFLNGRLLPHVFFPVDRSVSGTTSEETFRSSSANSTNSNNSSPTSYTPRTSISSIKDHHNDKTSLFNLNKTANTTKNVNIPIYSKGYKKMKSMNIVNVQIWEHITPVFRREGSGRSSRGGIKVGGVRRRRRKVAAAAAVEKRRGSKLMKWWRRIMKAVMLACRECHAMEPQRIVCE